MSLREAVARMFERHQEVPTISPGIKRCSCGWVSKAEAHSLHLADIAIEWRDLR